MQGKADRVGLLFVESARSVHRVRVHTFRNLLGPFEHRFGHQNGQFEVRLLFGLFSYAFGQFTLQFGVPIAQLNQLQQRPTSLINFNYCIHDLVCLIELFTRLWFSVWLKDLLPSAALNFSLFHLPDLSLSKTDSNV